MSHGLRHHRAARNRPAMAAVLVGLWLAGAMASTSSASPSVASAKPRGGHRCACGMDCGPVCCCKHKKADGPAPDRPKPPARPIGAGFATAPCVAPAPCGGALPPGVSSVARAGELADRAGMVAFAPATPSGLLVPPASDRAGSHLGSPPDEPPEPAFDA